MWRETKVLVLTGWIFYSQIQLHNFDTGWVYLGGLVPDSLQTTKRHSYNGYSIYMPSFNQFLPAVYPAGMTDLQPFFNVNNWS